MVRYADDLVILADKDATHSLAALGRLLEELGLALHPDKTRVVDANQGSFDFLGFNFRKAWNRQKTKRFALVLPSQKAQQSMRDKIRVLMRRERTKKVEDVVQQINPVIRGWANYFRKGKPQARFDEGALETCFGDVRWSGAPAPYSTFWTLGKTRRERPCAKPAR